MERVSVTSEKQNIAVESFREFLRRLIESRPPPIECLFQTLRFTDVVVDDVKIFNNTPEFYQVKYDAVVFYWINGFIIRVAIRKICGELVITAEFDHLARPDSL